MRRIYFLGVSIILAACTALAQNVGDCSNALEKDSLYVRSDELLSVSWLRIASDEALKAVNQGFDTGVTVPFKGIDYQGHGDFRNLRDEANKKADEEGWNYSDKQYLAFVSNYLSQNSGTAYANCLVALALSEPGIHVRVLSVTDSYITVHIHWHPPFNSPKVTRIVQLRGAKENSSDQVQTTFGPGDDNQDVTFALDQNNEFHLDIKAYGTSDWLIVPNPPKASVATGKYQGYHNVYPDWDSRYLLCTGTTIPKNVKVSARVGGSWSEINKYGVTEPYLRHNADAVHPNVGNWFTYIVVRSASGKLLSQSLPTYQNGGSTDVYADEPYDVCLDLPKVDILNEKQFKVTPGDPIRFDVVQLGPH
jgi:hypothetical protein